MIWISMYPNLYFEFYVYKLYLYLYSGWNTLFEYKTAYKWILNFLKIYSVYFHSIINLLKNHRAFYLSFHLKLSDVNDMKEGLICVNNLNQ